MNKSRRDMLSYCAEIYDDDGIPPHKLYKKTRKKTKRKNQQLCAQVARTLNLAFANSNNDIVASLYVISAIPAPDASKLLITVIQQTEERNTFLEICKEINNDYGRLRYEVGMGIHRKKVPTLSFVLGRFQ